MAEPTGPSLLRLRLNPAVPVLALGAGWLAASAGRFPSEGWLGLLLAVAATMCWHIWLAVCTSVPWADLSRPAIGAGSAPPFARLPFTEPGSAADRLSGSLGRLATWLRSSVWPHYGDAGVLGVFAVFMSFALALAIGPHIALLSLAAVWLGLLTAVIAARSVDRDASRGWVAALGGLGAIALPMCLGWLLVRELPAAYVVAAALLGLAYRARQASVFNAAYAALLALMLADRHSLGAFLLAVAWLPHFLFQAAQSSDARTRAAERWFAVAVLVAVLAFG